MQGKRVAVTLLTPINKTIVTQMAENYLTWYLETICRIPLLKEPLEDFDSHKMSNPDGPTDTCLIIIVTDPKETLKLENLNNRFDPDLDIPILAGFGAWRSLKRIEKFNHLFGSQTVRRATVKASTIRICPDDSTMEGAISYQIRTDKYLGTDTGSDSEEIEIISVDDRQGLRIISVSGNSPIAIVRDGFGYIGLKSVFFPREDRHLELGRGDFFLRILEKSIGQLCPYLPRLRMSQSPMAIRMDDPPTNWEINESESIFSLDDYRNTIEILENWKSCLTIMVTPFMASDSGDLRWRSESIPPGMKKIIDFLAETNKKGLIELGLHGARHLTIGYLPRDFRGTMRRALAGLLNQNPSREFYDSMKKKSIDVELQREAVGAAIEEFTNLFDIRPKIFTPPAHCWDQSTLHILEGHRIQYFSADCNFKSYPVGNRISKTPSPPGMMLGNSLLSISATILGCCTPDDLETFAVRGIPIIICTHNSKQGLANNKEMQELRRNVESDQRIAPMLLSELGDRLRKHNESKLEGIIESNGTIKIRVESGIPVDMVRFSNPSDIIVGSINAPEGREYQIDMRNT